MTIWELYQSVCHRLKAAGIPDYDSEAVILIGHFLHLSRGQIFLSGKRPAASKVISSIEAALAARLSDRLPLAYIIGEQDFWSRTFKVSPDVLIPRPETEILIEKVLEAFAFRSRGLKAKFLDLGTGSGIIAITLLLEMSDFTGVAIDRSMAALRVACDNARRLGVMGRLSFLNADWQSAVRGGQKFDLVVSNPPYVAREVLKSLQPELDHEPGIALDGGPKGRVEIDRLATGMSALLRPGGWLFMEIGFDQEDYVMGLFNSFGNYQQVMVHKDYAGLPRVLQAQLATETSN